MKAKGTSEYCPDCARGERLAVMLRKMLPIALALLWNIITALNYSRANKSYSFTFFFPKNCSGLFMFQQQLICYTQYLPHLFFLMLRICVYPASNLFVLINRIHLVSSSERYRGVILIPYGYHRPLILVSCSKELNEFLLFGTSSFLGVPTILRDDYKAEAH